MRLARAIEHEHNIAEIDLRQRRAHNAQCTLEDHIGKALQQAQQGGTIKFGTLPKLAEMLEAQINSLASGVALKRAGLKI